jgi:hypothetical protein
MRQTFAFSTSSKERFDKIKEEVGISSNAEVIRKALQVLEVVVEAEREGSEILIRKKSGDVLLFKPLV